MATEPASPIDPWEQAYLSFETSDEEIRKFVTRLSRLGAAAWPKQAAIVELFCGRGNGLIALESMGFSQLHGVDLSPRLLAEYRGPAACRCCDCRQLPFENEEMDFAIVQGGLHHLSELPDDLERTLSEVRRVLKPGGRFVAVEPWLTPFLRFVHGVASLRLVRKLSPKINALGTMIDHERPTYENWLRRPDEVRGVLNQYFETELFETGLGKLMFVGRNRG